MKKLGTIALLALLGFACDTQYFNPIPDASVYLKINTSTTDLTLNPIYSSKSFTSKRVGTDYIGYGGILVFHGTDRFYAYDLACPKEAQSKTIVIVEDILYARCPICKTKYDIYSGTGSPLEGPSKYALKSYNGINVNGSEITIYN